MKFQSVIGKALHNIQSHSVNKNSMIERVKMFNHILLAMSEDLIILIPFCKQVLYARGFFYHEMILCIFI